MSSIRALVLDVDGVLTDGRLSYDSDGEALKVFHVHDGLGMRLAQQFGMTICIISARDSAALRQRLDDLQVSHRYLGCHNKLEALDAWVSQQSLSYDEVAYVGDDVIDLPVLKRVGRPFTVPNAHPLVLAQVTTVTQRQGGQGAVREVVDQLLSEQMGLEAAYAEFLRLY